MSEETPNLSLPYIMPSQAQKHVIHNESIRALDALVQIGVKTCALNNPPDDPEDGSRYIIGSSAGGDWAGREGQLAAFQDGAWAFFKPQQGWVVYDSATIAMLVYDGISWKPAPVHLKPENWQHVEGIGINSSFDAMNRIAVASQASLFSHEGKGHQVKINKHDATDTASLLFQTNWSGRVEIGTAGDDNLHVKVSSNGAVWSNAIRIDSSTGYLGIGEVSPSRMVHIRGNNSNIRLDRDTNIAAMHIHRFPTNDYSVPWKGFVFGVDAQSNGVGRFVIADYGTAVTGPSVTRFMVENNGEITPGLDNNQPLGTASRRWSEVFAASGTISTSDERQKQQIGSIPDEWLDAWGDVQWSRYRFNQAVSEKGENARWHNGLIAQQIRDSFQAKGLDPFKLGVLCYDQWSEEQEIIAEDSENGDYVHQAFRPAGDLYGIRYEEALALEVSWIRRQLSRIS